MSSHRVVIKARHTGPGILHPLTVNPYSPTMGCITSVLKEASIKRTKEVTEVTAMRLSHGTTRQRQRSRETRIKQGITGEVSTEVDNVKPELEEVEDTEAGSR